MHTKNLISLLRKKEFACLFLILLTSFLFSTSSFSQLITAETTEKECINCFSSEIVNSEINENCITIDLQVNAQSTCLSALSHLSIEIPCGEISEVSNSEGWDMEIPMEDPTTGIKGFKIDNIKGFGEDQKASSFTVQFTVCSDDNSCIEKYENYLKIAYKAGQCVFYEEHVIKNTFTASLIPNHISCYEGNNGSIVATTTGGVPPMKYQWSNGSSQSSISGLRAGDYSVLITDSTGHEVELSTTLTQPLLPINIESSMSQTSCGQNDGFIELSVSGGTGSYSFLWNNGATTSSLTNLYKGKYSVQVFDSSGCYQSKSFNITDNSDLSVTLTPNFLECHQEDEGEITSQISGGTQPYQYLWSNGDTTTSISNVHSGSYTLTVTDAQGCSNSASTYIGIKSISISTSVINPTCNGGNDGELSVSDVRYGNAPYSYLWDTGDTTSTISALISGKYKVVVTDINGCEATRTINVADRQALNINYSISPRDCSSGTEAEINLDGTGGMPPYTYYVAGELITSPYVIDITKTYEITIKDAFGCEFTKTISIQNGNNDISVEAIISQPACGGSNTGAAELIISGGLSPYIFTWSDGVISQNRTDLASGEYIIEVIDTNGCSASTSFVIDSVNTVSALITTPENKIECESANNILYATSFGASTYTWEILNNSSWTIESSLKDKLNYYAGTGEATIIYSAMNNEGCLASDTILLNCIEDDQSGGNSNDSIFIDPDYDDECMSGCTYSEITNIFPLDNNCYLVEMWVYTDGTCAHELSHLNVGLEYGQVNWVNNSRNWKIEMNTTDPKNGIYGIKIDDINGFGQTGSDKFKIEYEVCFNHPTQENYFPEYIPVAYKAATCYSIQKTPTHNKSDSNSGLVASVFPNPFKEQVTLTVISKSDTEVEIAMYDISGNKIESIYMGNVLAEVKYTFTFIAPENSERIFFYKIISRDNTIQGKILRIK